MSSQMGVSSASDVLASTYRGENIGRNKLLFWQVNYAMCEEFDS